MTGESGPSPLGSWIVDRSDAVVPLVPGRSRSDKRRADDSSLTLGGGGAGAGAGAGAAAVVGISRAGFSGDRAAVAAAGAGLAWTGVVSESMFMTDMGLEDRTGG